MHVLCIIYEIDSLEFIHPGFFTSIPIQVHQMFEFLKDKSTKYLKVQNNTGLEKKYRFFH